MRSHTCSIRLKSGDCEGQLNCVSWVCLFHSSTTREQWQRALTSWNKQGVFPKCLATICHRLLSSVSIYLTEFMLPFIIAKVPTPWYVRHPQTIIFKLVDGASAKQPRHSDLQISEDFLQTFNFPSGLIIIIISSVKMTFFHWFPTVQWSLPLHHTIRFFLFTVLMPIFLRTERLVYPKSAICAEQFVAILPQACVH